MQILLSRSWHTTGLIWNIFYRKDKYKVIYNENEIHSKKDDIIASRKLSANYERVHVFRQL